MSGTFWDNMRGITDLEHANIGGYGMPFPPLLTLFSIVGILLLIYIFTRKDH